MTNDTFVEFLAVVGVFYLPFVCILLYFCHRAFKSWFETALKRDMVARGFTTREIIEVVAAERGSTATVPLSDIPPAKPIRQPAYTP